MEKYQELVSKFAKEDEGDVNVVSKKNAPILKSKLEAKIKALEAREMEQRADLVELEDSILKAKATLTTDIDMWLNNVKQARSKRDELAEELQDTTFTISIYNDWLKIF